MTAKFFNTAFSLSMISDGVISTKTLTPEQAAAWLAEGSVENAANPNHGASLVALKSRFGIDMTSPKGGRVSLKAGDQCLVAQIGGLPPLRETREYTEEEVAKATFEFRLVTVQPENSFVVSKTYLERAKGSQSDMAGQAGVDIGDYALDEYVDAILNGDPDRLALVEKFLKIRRGTGYHFGGNHEVWVSAKGGYVPLKEAMETVPEDAMKPGLFGLGS